MPAEIKARLELVTGDTGAPAAGSSAAGGDSFKDLAKDFKEMTRIMKKPSSIFGGGSGSGSDFAIFGAMAAAAFASGFGAAALGDKLGTWIGESAREAFDKSGFTDLIMNAFGKYKPTGDFTNLPANQPQMITDMGFEPMGDYWDTVRAVDEIEKIKKQILEYEKDGVTFSEAYEINKLKEIQALYEQLSNQKDLTAEQETQLKLKIEMTGYINSYVSNLKNQLSAEKELTAELQKQADLKSKISSGSAKSGFSGDVAGNTYQFSGKSYQLGGTEKYIGIRTVK